MRTDFKGAASKQNLLGEEKVFAQLRGVRGSPCHPGKNMQPRRKKASPPANHSPKRLLA